MIIYWGKCMPTDNEVCMQFYIAGKRVGGMTIHEDHQESVFAAMAGFEFIHCPRDLNDYFWLGPPLTDAQREQMEYDLERMGP